MTAENDPGQLFRAVGDITKHNDISHISQINRSKSFEQFPKKTLFLFHAMKNYVFICSSLLRGLHLLGHLCLCHGRRHPEHPSHGASWERCKYHVTMAEGVFPRKRCECDKSVDVIYAMFTIVMVIRTITVFV